MSYIGDFAFGQVIDHQFTSRDSVGTPSTLSGVILAIGRANSTSSFSQGLSLTTNFGGIAGRNHVRITTASSSTQFLEGHDYNIFVLAGQVSPITIVGEVVGSFSVSNRFGGATAYGPLQAVASTSQLSLPSTATTTNDIYNGSLIVMATGPGQHQSRFLSDYTGATFSAQLDSALGTAVTSATTVVIYPGAPSVPGSINSIVPGSYSGVSVGVSSVDPSSVVSSNVQFVNHIEILGDGSASSFHV